MSKVKSQKRQFLKALLLTPASLPLANFITNQRATNQTNGIVLQTSIIRGFAYYQGNTILKTIRVGDSLNLQREADNQYDRKAIGVYWKNTKLGYLPRDENATLAQMLDRGQTLTANVSQVIIDNDWQPLDVEVRLLT